MDNQPAVKLQWYIGTRTSADLRGGEPTDNHGTIMEIDPAPQTLVDLVLAGGEAFNEEVEQFIKPLKGSNLLGHMIPPEAEIGIFVMDGDGRV